jgi:hypothetical protein
MSSTFPLDSESCYEELTIDVSRESDNRPKFMFLNREMIVSNKGTKLNCLKALNQKIFIEGTKEWFMYYIPFKTTGKNNESIEFFITKRFTPEKRVDARSYIMKKNIRSRASHYPNLMSRNEYSTFMAHNNLEKLQYTFKNHSGLNLKIITQKETNDFNKSARSFTKIFEKWILIILAIAVAVAFLFILSYCNSMCICIKTLGKCCGSIYSKITKTTKFLKIRKNDPINNSSLIKNNNNLTTPSAPVDSENKSLMGQAESTNNNIYPQIKYDVRKGDISMYSP